MRKHSNKKGFCIWITGLSASGKTTTARQLRKIFLKNKNSIILLDGDQLRQVLEITAYDRAGRFEAGLKYANLVKLLTDQGHNVVIAVIGLFHELHRWNRLNIGNYFEVFLDVPLTELSKRDPKGIYEAYRNAEVQNVAGLDLQVEYPLSPDLHVKFNKLRSAKQIAEQIYIALKSAGLKKHL